MPFKGAKAVHKSVHELDGNLTLRFRKLEDAHGDDRKSSMVFLSKDGKTYTNLVAFKELAKSSDITVFRAGVNKRIKLAEVQVEDVVYASTLSRLQKESVMAFRKAYGTEDWVVSDFRAWAVCCQIADRIRPMQAGKEEVLWSQYRTGSERFETPSADSGKSARTWVGKFDSKPLEFKLVGHGTKEEGATRWSELGRKNPQAEKFDIEIVNPNTGKSVFLEVSGCDLTQFTKSTMWVQKAKLDYAVKHPERLNIFALAHKYDSRPTLTADSPWEHQAIDFMVLDKRAAALHDGIKTIKNRSHVTEEFYAFNANSRENRGMSSLIRDKNSNQFFVELMTKLDFDDRPYRTLRLNRGGETLSAVELKKLTQEIKPPRELISDAIAFKKDAELAARPVERSRGR